MKNPPCWESATIVIVVYRRSWRDVSPGLRWQMRKKRIGPTKRPVQSAAAEEIGFGAFGSFFLMISTSALESTKRFPHLPRGPAADHSIANFEIRQRKTCLPDRSVKE